MKKLWSICIVLVISLTAQAQGQFVQGLLNQTPNESFIRKNLFEIKKEKDNPTLPIERDVRAYTLCKLNQAALDQLVNQKPAALILQVPLDGIMRNIRLIKNPCMKEDFLVRTQAGLDIQDYDYQFGAYYLGVIENMPNTIAAISFFHDDIVGVISNGNGNYVLGKSDIHATNSLEYIVYNDKDLLIENPSRCGTLESMRSKASASMTQSAVTETITTKCVKIYFECDYQFYLDHGSNTTTATNFATSLFNNVSTLYLNDSVSTGISQILVWTTSDPYASFMSTGDMLDTFSSRMYANGFNGDLAHLLSNKSAGGGIAWLDVLCDIDYYKCGVSASLENSITSLPTYSWNSNVITHELGHNIASPHTHACAWNGNNTRIDNCAGNYNIAYQEGNCNSFPANPPAGGTMMSYCHLQSVGVNLSLGFGPQPGALVRSKVNGAACLTPCITCPSNITITGAYSTALTESTTWIKTSGQTTISASSSVKLDANPTSGYILIAPSSASDFLLAQPNSAGKFVAQALDGCAGSQPQLPAGTNWHQQENTLIAPFTLFPNPTDQVLSLSQEEISGEMIDIDILSLEGKVCYSAKNILFDKQYSLSLASLHAGLYFIRISRNQHVETLKFQKL